MKKNHYNFASLSCEKGTGSCISMPKLDHELLHDYFGGNLWQSVFFGSGRGFVNWTQSDPGFVNPVQSSPGLSIRSDPIWSGFCKRPVKGIVSVVWSFVFG